MTGYEINYRQGYFAGRQYLWPSEWRTVHRNEDGTRTVRGHGTMPADEAAGWMRGFRHGCMDAATTREP